MPDYEKMYFDLFRATEDAINLLVAAQLRCEEAYIEHLESEVDESPSK